MNKKKRDFNLFNSNCGFNKYSFFSFRTEEVLIVKVALRRFHYIYSEEKLTEEVRTAWLFKRPLPLSLYFGRNFYNICLRLHQEKNIKGIFRRRTKYYQFLATSLNYAGRT